MSLIYKKLFANIGADTADMMDILFLSSGKKTQDL